MICALLLKNSSMLNKAKMGTPIVLIKLNGMITFISRKIRRDYSGEILSNEDTIKYIFDQLHQYFIFS